MTIDAFLFLIWKKLMSFHFGIAEAKSIACG
jgi:hypothetical protein